MKSYLILTPFLPDGKYKTSCKEKWHERLRIKIALWLYKSVPKNSELEIKTTTGVSDGK